jgi:uncharacterized protein YndB with AHSA1/START domain
MFLGLARRWTGLPEILHQLVIEVPPAAVFDAITTQRGLSSWWTIDVKAEPTIGSIGEFGFNSRAAVFEIRVVGLDRPHFVRWHCLAGHAEWANTDLVFAMSTHRSGTVLRFAHRGWESSDGILAQCSYDWARYLTSLKSYLETGTGSPHRADSAPEGVE